MDLIVAFSIYTRKTNNACSGKYVEWFLHVFQAPECSSAAFSEELPEWLVRLFNNEKDTTIPDLFIGLGTTLILANQRKRRFIDMDVMPIYCEKAKGRLSPIEQFSSYEI